MTNCIGYIILIASYNNKGGNMVVFTVEIPKTTKAETKVAAAIAGITVKQFVDEALQEKIAKVRGCK